MWAAKLRGHLCGVVGAVAVSIYLPEACQRKAWPAMPADRFAHFLALARQGTPRPIKAPAGEDRKTADQAYQRGEIERSLKYCKDVLGLGR